jgi:NADH-quinone oxidoreductase subunit F
MLERMDHGEATPMDLDIIESVCDHIMGNCLCVLGDAMAMPIASMVKHFRAEFEAHMEAARERAGLGAAVPVYNRGAQGGAYPMLEPDGKAPTVALA